MENASQALLIAGGIFLALLTIGVLIVMLGHAGTIQNAQQSKEEVERIAKWNDEWQAYNKSYLYATEVYTVLKKVAQNNSENAYKIKISINNGTTESDDVDTVNNWATEQIFNTYIEPKITKIYICTKMEYNNATGRVDTIWFRER